MEELLVQKLAEIKKLKKDGAAPDVIKKEVRSCLTLAAHVFSVASFHPFFYLSPPLFFLAICPSVSIMCICCLGLVQSCTSDRALFFFKSFSDAFQMIVQHPDSTCIIHNIFIGSSFHAVYPNCDLLHFSHRSSLHFYFLSFSLSHPPPVRMRCDIG